MSLEYEYRRELRRQDEAISKALAQAKEEGYEPEQVVVTLGMPTAGRAVAGLLQAQGGAVG